MKVNLLVAFLEYILISFKYHLKYLKILVGCNSLSDFEVVSIEFCSVCNLKCKYCYLDKKNRPKFLDIAIYEKLLKEICENKAFRIKIMEWPISGCFFLHPQYKEIVFLTKKYKEKYSNFSPWIILNDNMMLFDEDKIDFILKHNIVNQIICSLDGRNKHSYENMRPNARFETIIKNINSLIKKNRECKNKVVLQINNGWDPECATRSFDPLYEEIFRHADHVTTWSPVDWNESFHTDSPIFNPGKRFCSFVFESITMSTSGSIIKCCMDLQELTKYGDFTKNNLESILLSNTRKGFLFSMFTSRRRLIPGCKNCSITYVGQNKLGFNQIG